MNAQSGKLMSMILAGLCGLLMLIAVAQRFGLGRGYSLLADAAEPVDMALLKPLRQSNHALPPEPSFDEIRARPLFSATRTPQKIETTAAFKPDDRPPVPLNATLTGTIVNASGQRLALVRDNNSSKVMVLKEGMSMPGELMGWTLKSIEPRKAVFDGGAGQGLAELKLDVNKLTGAAPPPPPPMANAALQNPGNPGNPGNNPGQAQMAPQPQAMQPGVQVTAAAPPAADQAAREEEVRRIIEERRAQMRAEAAKQGGG